MEIKHWKIILYIFMLSWAILFLPISVDAFDVDSVSDIILFNIAILRVGLLVAICALALIILQIKESKVFGFIFGSAIVNMILTLIGGLMIYPMIGSQISMEFEAVFFAIWQVLPITLMLLPIFMVNFWFLEKENMIKKYLVGISGLIFAAIILFLNLFFEALMMMDL